MGCSTHRKKQTREFADQKWDYINLNDFKANGCGAPFAYGYLWFSLVLSIAVYSVDSFTAVNLLAFDKWSSSIDPGIPLHISKWIFSVCIILSFLNLGYEGWRAWKVMRRQNVAECYMDNLAVKWESIRVGQGQGWKRFLVFASLTKSKKGAEYIALFTYFSFQSWIRVIICSGPRQVVNAFTLRAVYIASLEVKDEDPGHSILSFFGKIGKLAEENTQQVVILSGMCFTFVVWAFSVIFLLLAFFFYVFFLFHWIPRTDGGLSGYCERKVNKALLKIVTKKVNKALAKQQAKEIKAARKNGEKPTLDRTATLPTLPDLADDDGLPSMPSARRNDSISTLPMYETRPCTPSHIEMSNLDSKRPFAVRTETLGSNASYSSNQPLIGAAADMGYGRSSSPAPSLQEPMFPYGRSASPAPSLRDPTLPSFGPARSASPAPSYREPTVPHMGLSIPTTGSQAAVPNMNMAPIQPPIRPGTANSQRNLTHQPGFRHQGRPSDASNYGPFADTPAARQASMRPESPAFARATTTRPGDGYERPSATPVPMQDPYARGGYNQSPAPTPMNYYPPPRQQTPLAQQGPPRRPVRSATDRLPPPQAQRAAPQRNMTGPVPPATSIDTFTRPSTPQGMHGPPVDYSHSPGGRAQYRRPDYQSDYDPESQRGGY